jgi:Leucine-rich repeat (LRR) protein
MQYFYISDNPVGSIDVVGNYDDLIELGAARTGLTDLSPIAGKNLTYLWVNNNATLEDFSSINTMTTLEALLVGDTGFDDNDMPLLANKSSLQRLQLWANEGVSDISVLESLSRLTQEIDIGGTSVTDLSPIYGLTDLKQLRVYHLGLTSAEIDFLRDFNQLEVLYLDGNELTDISTLVRNSGIADGDVVNISDNLLNLNDPSVQADIQTLLERGVNLTFEPQSAGAP